MTPKDQCLEDLLGFIERSDRAELAETQAAIIQFALRASDVDARAEAMAELQGDLAGRVEALSPQPIQLAYHAVVDAMIDRTREAVLGPKSASDRDAAQ